MSTCKIYIKLNDDNISSIAMSLDSSLDIEHLSGTPNMNYKQTAKKSKMIIPNNIAKSNVDQEEVEKMY